LDPGTSTPLRAWALALPSHPRHQLRRSRPSSCRHRTLSEVCCRAHQCSPKRSRPKEARERQCPCPYHRTMTSMARSQSQARPKRSRSSRHLHQYWMRIGQQRAHLLLLLLRLL
ncbi:hypothetical protein FOZ62_022038, partial [Perkinsus olseni]